MALSFSVASKAQDDSQTTGSLTAPANDNFANNPAFIGNTSGVIIATNAEATGEPGEPIHGAGRGGSGNQQHSVWFRITPSVTKVIVIWTSQGTIGDTVMSAYIGSSVGALLPIAENDNYPGMGNLSRMTFLVEAGQTYHVAIDGAQGATGSFTLNYQNLLAPPNDMFANGEPLFGTSSPYIGVTGTTVMSTGEPGEPNHVGNSGSMNSIWYSWTAPADLSMTFYTFGSSFDTTISIYTGSAVNALTLIDYDDDAGPNTSSRVTFMATAGTTYRIAIEGFGSHSGRTLLNWNINRAESGERFDFSGDRTSDMSTYRPLTGEWWITNSATSQVSATQFGGLTDTMTPGDFTGDGKVDIAFWRPATGAWYILRTDDNTYYSFPYGASGDIPMPADYDGDALMDAAVYRNATATWYIRNASGVTFAMKFGLISDKPVAADYDGDGKADLAVYRPSTGYWWYLRSSDGGSRAYQFGTGSDRPVQGDYTGDGRADIAFWRPSSGEWFVLRSQDESFYSVPFGMNGDVPAPGDYDGDGRLDPTVFRPSSATWYMNRSTAGTKIVQYGAQTDRPVPSAYVR